MNNERNGFCLRKYGFSTDCGSGGSGGSGVNGVRSDNELSDHSVVSPSLISQIRATYRHTELLEIHVVRSGAIKVKAG
ncbi:hypothetical protein J6590_034952 [Homalodisca vitripennis]|nr:hypothetical protein J6590_034952 [Homalodisca vitripennis]